MRSFIIQQSAVKPICRRSTVNDDVFVSCFKKTCFFHDLGVVQEDSLVDVAAIGVPCVVYDRQNDLGKLRGVYSPGPADGLLVVIWLAFLLILRSGMVLQRTAAARTEIEGASAAGTQATTVESRRLFRVDPVIRDPQTCIRFDWSAER